MEKINKRKALSRRKFLGFSIVEVLISISVISIAMLGVLGSLGYARASTKQTSQLTEASALQRRMLELVLQGGPKGPYISGTNNLNSTAPSPYDGVWHKLDYMVDQNGTNPTNPLDIRDFLINDTANPASDDYKTFQNLINKGYEMRVTLTPGTVNTYTEFMCTVTVDVRWTSDKKVRQVSTSAMYRRGSTQ